MPEPGNTTFYPVVLESVQREYGEVHTYTFRPQAPLPFLAGQHVHLLAPGLELGKPNVRHMSVASTPADPLLQFSMDLASGSPYKQAFHEAKPGQSTQIFKIGGDFTLDAGNSPLVFLAGGIGITPFRSLIRALEEAGRPRAWTLVHVSRDAFLYQAEFSPLPFTQHRVGRQAFLELLPGLVAEQREAEYYLCGSRGFVEGVAQTLGELGIAPERIKTEDFR